MADFIEDFYYGNIEPQECTTELNSKLKKKPKVSTSCANENAYYEIFNEAIKTFTFQKKLFHFAKKVSFFL